MHEWLSGGVSPCQGEGRGFESRLVLFCVLTDKERMDCRWLPDDMQVLLAFFNYRSVLSEAGSHQLVQVQLR